MNRLIGISVKFCNGDRFNNERQFNSNVIRRLTIKLHYRHPRFIRFLDDQFVGDAGVGHGLNF